MTYTCSSGTVTNDDTNFYSLKCPRQDVQLLSYSRVTVLGGNCLERWLCMIPIKEEVMTKG